MAFASTRIGAQEAIIQPCDLCEDDEDVNWFCKDCGQNLCERCKRSHLRSNVSKSHIVLSISEGFAMGKRNISNICRDHDELFTFFCRTCKRNICFTCLSMEHKKDDFVDLRELQIELQKQLDDVIREKEKEKNKMTELYNELVQLENESQVKLEEQYANIDYRLKLIKVTADEEAEKLKELFRSKKDRQQNELTKGKHRIKTQINMYGEEIKTVQQDLRLQIASSFYNFVKTSMDKLESLHQVSAAIPDTGYESIKARVDENQIRQMVGKMLGTQKAAGAEKDEAKYEVLQELENIRFFNLNKIQSCYCLCRCPDGSIWIGGEGFVYKMSDDCTTVLYQISSRKKWACYHIACFKSGDAVVSYGGASQVDRFTSDGRIEFVDLSPRSTQDIAVNNHAEVVINVHQELFVIFSNEGKQLREFKVNGNIRTFCLSRYGYIIIAHPGSSKITTIDDMSGKQKLSCDISMSDIARLASDRYGNIIGMKRKNHICILNKDDEVHKTFTVDCDSIKGIHVDYHDHLLILIYKNKEYQILVTNYLQL